MAPARPQLVAVLVLSVALLVASAVGLLAIDEALEERQAVAAANDLRLAAYRVAIAGPTTGPDDLVDREDGPIVADPVGDRVADGPNRSLASAVATLRSAPDSAFHGLDRGEAAGARRLVRLLVEQGEAHLAGEARTGAPPAQRSLDALLERVAIEAGTDADQAERVAMVAVLAVAALAGISGVVLVRARAKEVRLRRSLAVQAQTDLLTGLPNRRVLDHHLREAAQQMARTGRMAALLILDLDGFKNVNDRFGHPTGDRVLVESAERLMRSCDGDIRSLRLGADEFAVLLPDVRSAGHAERTARYFQEILDRPFEIEGGLERLGVSVGLAVTGDPERVAELAADADLALHRAKRVGGNQVVLFDPSMETTLDSTSRIIQALRSADHKQEFHLVYQPIFTVDGTTVHSYEALLRWESPTLGTVGPDVFIPIAEHCGEIVAIGRWVLERVCRQIRAWEAAGLATDLPVSVNVSPVELASPRFVGDVIGLLDRWQVPRHRLVVEVTESAVLEHGVAVERLAELRARGVRIAIDDFGSGYSNIGQILRVPFDVLKIDRSLLTSLTEMRLQAGDDPNGPCPVMLSVVSIASVFGAEVVCEGVETDQQRRSLEASGVDLVQGFLLGRPAPPIGVDAGSPRIPPSPSTRVAGAGRPRRRSLPT
jgi:diguanylate cyclase (GGDEF)-like protein